MERDEGMDVLEGRVIALNGMIDELLQYAEIESGRMAWRIERVDLGRLLHHCLDGFAPVLTEKNLQLQREIAPDLGEAQLDPTKLTHVVGNLVANAIRFTPAGSVTVRARPAPPSRGNRWRLEVEDTGIGIAREELSRIFHEFYQVPIPDGATGGRGRSSASEGAAEQGAAKQQDLLSRTPCTPSASLRGVTTPSPARPVTSIPAGHGLGLAIVRHLCGAMGARVTVASEPGRGTRFALQLPRRMRAPKG
jgi:signal transduction histidine kinase